jgi:hypothetical protein
MSASRRWKTNARDPIGPWEQRELDYARVAVPDRFLRLALVAEEKALIVSQLPRAEYEYGLNYGRPGIDWKRAGGPQMHAMTVTRDCND